MAVSEKQKKRRAEESPHSNMVAVRDLDEQQISPKDSGKKMNKEKYSEGEGSRARENKLAQESNAVPSCIDKLREELSCPICSEICYEPTSLWCGHSFCIRCLRLAVIKFGNKCPKCQHFIRKSRPYILNTVIWNTIQLLFSQEVVVVRDLDEQQISPKDGGKKMKKKKYSEGEGSRARENKLTQESNGLPSCIDKLREELSCPICFEIFFVPVSTVCGHSFCYRCLTHSLIRNGNKCPSCRQSISFSLEYNENTVIKNTTSLLFYPEVKSKIDDNIKEGLAAFKHNHIRFEQEE